MDAGTHIARAAHDLKTLSGAHIHLAHAELVGVWMGLALPYETHHHAGGTGSQIFNGIHLEAGDRQPLGKGLNPEALWRGGHQLLQPLERDPHSSVPSGTPDPKEPWG